jgi:hypothetical protein
MIAIDGKVTPKQIVGNLRLKFGVDVNKKAARRVKATLLKTDTTRGVAPSSHKLSELTTGTARTGSSGLCSLQPYTPCYLRPH